MGDAYSSGSPLGQQLVQLRALALSVAFGALCPHKAVARYVCRRITFQRLEARTQRLHERSVQTSTTVLSVHPKQCGVENYLLMCIRPSHVHRPAAGPSAAADLATAPSASSAPVLRFEPVEFDPCAPLDDPNQYLPRQYRVREQWECVDLEKGEIEPLAVLGSKGAKESALPAALVARGRPSRQTRILLSAIALGVLSVYTYVSYSC